MGEPTKRPTANKANKIPVSWDTEPPLDTSEWYGSGPESGDLPFCKASMTNGTIKRMYISINNADQELHICAKKIHTDRNNDTINHHLPLRQH